MPFRSQPQKKPTRGLTPSASPEAKPASGTRASAKTGMDSRTARQLIDITKQKIAKKFLDDPRAAEKAAFILTEWLKKDKYRKKNSSR